MIDSGHNNVRIICFLFFSSRRRHTICALVTGVQTCALPIFERLVGPTIIEPLRADWAGVRVAATELIDQGKAEEARRTVEAFHTRLAQTRVLDPACGTEIGRAHV